PNCHGTGSVRVQQRTVFGTMASSATCPNCRGEGKIIHKPCKKCNGSGTARKQKKISINIPSGIDDGQAISLRGQGDQGRNGGPAGDLVIGIRIKPHEKLRRDGTTIYLEQVITFFQAALGTEIEIPTLDGKVKYNIPEGTQTGTTFRLRGKGVPALNGRGRGDQLVTVKVDVPKNLTTDQKEALRQYGVAMGEVSQVGEEEESKPFFGKSKKKK
ncbi:MAG: DnaJ C-terminal domain-containing protein, partial [Evtepia sp.]